MVLFMAVLPLVSTSLRAESGAPLPPPTFDIPFDDIDPVVAQAELTQHITVFLNRLQTSRGSSPEVIRDQVTGDVERDERDTLVVGKHFADHGVLEGYEFQEGSLVAGHYLVLQRPVNGLNEFIDYYAALKRSLSEHYGQPREDRIVWTNDLYQPLPDYWGIAVQMGHLRYAARWDTPAGMITVELTGNHHSRLAIDYRSHAVLEPSRNT
ncbi:exported hypothetical protein [Nitrospira lenta]|uniref:Uncharacterized protein n=2 Tax=Nitrospira lenta TaxID=1436998 RepID=A0A330LGY1_9BACT|nr:exported hypothetical protein [Nitrospira lenta]